MVSSEACVLYEESEPNERKPTAWDIERAFSPLMIWNAAFATVNRTTVAVSFSPKPRYCRVELGDLSFEYLDEEFAADWVNRGVGIAGGCCKVGPALVALLAKRFKSKHTNSVKVQKPC